MIYIQPGVYVAADQIASCELEPLSQRQPGDATWSIVVTLKDGRNFRHEIDERFIELLSDPEKVADYNAKIQTRSEVMHVPVPNFFRPRLPMTRDAAALVEFRNFIERIERDRVPDLDYRGRSRPPLGL